MKKLFVETKHLILRPATPDVALADLKNRPGFAKLLGAEIPAAWPPEFYDDDAKRWTLRSTKRDPEGLFTYYFLLKRGERQPVLIGCGGFKGRSKNGVTEIGYSMLPEWQGRGLGTEIVRALLMRAFEDSDVHTVCAHTLPALIPSQRVLEKNGFRRRGMPTEKDAIRYEITRAEIRRS